MVVEAPAIERPTVVESYEGVIPRIPNIAAACCSPFPVAAELGFVFEVRPPLVPRVHRSPQPALGNRALHIRPPVPYWPGVVIQEY